MLVAVYDIYRLQLGRSRETAESTRRRGKL